MVSLQPFAPRFLRLCMSLVQVLREKLDHRSHVVNQHKIAEAQQALLLLHCLFAIGPGLILYQLRVVAVPSNECLQLHVDAYDSYMK